MWKEGPSSGPPPTADNLSTVSTTGECSVVVDSLREALARKDTVDYEIDTKLPLRRELYAQRALLYRRISEGESVEEKLAEEELEKRLADKSFEVTSPLLKELIKVNQAHHDLSEELVELDKEQQQLAAKIYDQHLLTRKVGSYTIADTPSPTQSIFTDTSTSHGMSNEQFKNELRAMSYDRLTQLYNYLATNAELTGSRRAHNRCEQVDRYLHLLEVRDPFEKLVEWYAYDKKENADDILERSRLFLDALALLTTDERREFYNQLLDQEDYLENIAARFGKENYEESLNEFREIRILLAQSYPNSIGFHRAEALEQLLSVDPTDRIFIPNKKAATYRTYRREHSYPYVNEYFAKKPLLVQQLSFFQIIHPEQFEELKQKTQALRREMDRALESVKFSDEKQRETFISTYNQQLIELRAEYLNDFTNEVYPPLRLHYAKEYIDNAVELNETLSRDADAILSRYRIDRWIRNVDARYEQIGYRGFNQTFANALKTRGFDTRGLNFQRRFPTFLADSAAELRRLKNRYSVVLDNQDLRGRDFANSNFRTAVFRNCDFSNSSFDNVYVDRDTVFERVNFSGADLSRIRNLENVSLRGSYYDDNTEFPTIFDRKTGIASKLDPEKCGMIRIESNQSSFTDLQKQLATSFSDRFAFLVLQTAGKYPNPLYDGISDQPMLVSREQFEANQLVAIEEFLAEIPKKIKEQKERIEQAGGFFAARDKVFRSTAALFDELKRQNVTLISDILKSGTEEELNAYLQLLQLTQLQQQYPAYAAYMLTLPEKPDGVDRSANEKFLLDKYTNLLTESLQSPGLEQAEIYEYWQALFTFNPNAGDLREEQKRIEKIYTEVNNLAEQSWDNLGEKQSIVLRQMLDEQLNDLRSELRFKMLDKMAAEDSRSKIKEHAPIIDLFFSGHEGAQSVERERGRFGRVSDEIGRASQKLSQIEQLAKNGNLTYALKLLNDMYYSKNKVAGLQDPLQDIEDALWDATAIDPYGNEQKYWMTRGTIETIAGLPVHAAQHPEETALIAVAITIARRDKRAAAVLWPLLSALSLNAYISYLGQSRKLLDLAHKTRNFNVAMEGYRTAGGSLVHAGFFSLGATNSLSAWHSLAKARGLTLPGYGRYRLAERIASARGTQSRSNSTVNELHDTFVKPTLTPESVGLPRQPGSNFSAPVRSTWIRSRPRRSTNSKAVRRDPPTRDSRHNPQLRNGNNQSTPGQRFTNPSPRIGNSHRTEGGTSSSIGNAQRNTPRGENLQSPPGSRSTNPNQMRNQARGENQSRRGSSLDDVNLPPRQQTGSNPQTQTQGANQSSTGTATLTQPQPRNPRVDIKPPEKFGTDRANPGNQPKTQPNKQPEHFEPRQSPPLRDTPRHIEAPKEIIEGAALGALDSTRSIEELPQHNIIDKKIFERLDDKITELELIEFLKINHPRDQEANTNTLDEAQKQKLKKILADNLLDGIELFEELEGLLLDRLISEEEFKLELEHFGFSESQIAQLQKFRSELKSPPTSEETQKTETPTGPVASSDKSEDKKPDAPGKPIDKPNELVESLNDPDKANTALNHVETFFRYESNGQMTITDRAKTMINDAIFTGIVANEKCTPELRQRAIEILEKYSFLNKKFKEPDIENTINAFIDYFATNAKPETPSDVQSAGLEFLINCFIDRYNRPTEQLNDIADALSENVVRPSFFRGDLREFGPYPEQLNTSARIFAMRSLRDVIEKLGLEQKSNYINALIAGLKDPSMATVRAAASCLGSKPVAYSIKKLSESDREIYHRLPQEVYSHLFSHHRVAAREVVKINAQIESGDLPLTDDVRTLRRRFRTLANICGRAAYNVGAALQHTPKFAPRVIQPEERLEARVAKLNEDPSRADNPLEIQSLASFIANFNYKLPYGIEMRARICEVDDKLTLVEITLEHWGNTQGIFVGELHRQKTSDITGSRPGPEVDVLVMDKVAIEINAHAREQLPPHTIVPFLMTFAALEIPGEKIDEVRVKLRGDAHKQFMRTLRQLVDGDLEELSAVDLIKHYHKEVKEAAQRTVAMNLLTGNLMGYELKLVKLSKSGPVLVFQSATGIFKHMLSPKNPSENGMGLMHVQDEVAQGSWRVAQHVIPELLALLDAHSQRVIAAVKAASDNSLNPKNIHEAIRMIDNRIELASLRKSNFDVARCRVILNLLSRIDEQRSRFYIEETLLERFFEDHKILQIEDPIEQFKAVARAIYAVPWRDGMTIVELLEKDAGSCLNKHIFLAKCLDKLGIEYEHVIGKYYWSKFKLHNEVDVLGEPLYTPEMKRLLGANDFPQLHNFLYVWPQGRDGPRVKVDIMWDSLLRELNFPGIPDDWNGLTDIEGVPNTEEIWAGKEGMISHKVFTNLRLTADERAVRAAFLEALAGRLDQLRRKLQSRRPPRRPPRIRPLEDPKTDH